MSNPTLVSYDPDRVELLWQFSRVENRRDMLEKVRALHSYAYVVRTWEDLCVPYPDFDSLSDVDLEEEYWSLYECLRMSCYENSL